MYTRSPAPDSGFAPRIPGRSHVIGGLLATRKDNSQNGAGKRGAGGSSRGSRARPNGAAPKPRASGYDAKDITVLEGLEAVRRRPGMYIGSTGPRGLHHLVYEVVDNSVDEALQGYCDHITVVLAPDGRVTVTDNGRGIPVDVMPDVGLSAV